jgi:hypothetical protein
MSRRRLIADAAALAIVPALGAGAATVADAAARAPARRATPRDPPDFRDPKARLAALIRMRGALDERLVISFLEGVYYGVMEARIRPLYGLSAGLFRQYRARPDGGYDYVNLELVYVTDLDSGELLTEFHNPWSGRTGKPPQTRLGPTRLTITPDLEVQRPGAAGHAAAAGTFHRFRSPRVVGDDVWIVEESAVQAPPPMNFAFNEVLSYRASLAQLSDPALAHVPTEVQFTPVIGWRPWQGMEGYVGPPSHVMGVCAGKVVTSLDELPARYREWTARFHPDVAADPLQLLSGAWAAR